MGINWPARHLVAHRCFLWGCCKTPASAQSFCHAALGPFPAQRTCACKQTRLW